MAEPGELLSAREHEILCLVATGATNRMVARQLGISHNTVKVHLRNIFTKLEINSRTEATVIAIREGWVELTESAGDRERPEEQPAVKEPGVSDVALEQESTTLPIQVPLPTGKRIFMVMSLLFVGLVSFLTWPRFNIIPANGCSNEFTADCALEPSALTVDETESLWVSESSLPQPLGRFGLVSLESRLILVGGETVDGVTGAVNIYDSVKDEWSKGRDKPTPAANISVVFIEGKIYAPGGSDAQGDPLSVMEMYDPFMDEWVSGSSIPNPLTAYAATAFDGKLYVLGGWDGGGYTGEGWLFDPAIDTWTPLPPMPTPRGFAAAAAINGQVFVLGGYDGQREFSTCEVLDIAGGSWSMCQPMSAPRGGLGVAMIAGQIYVIGGGWESFVTFSERYNPASDTWHNVETPLLLAGGEWRNLGVAAIGTRVYALGGWQQGRYLNINQGYETLPNRLYLPAAISP